MSDVMIEARGLTKRYGLQRALDNANFEVRKGQIVGFLGPNGAGKSTTMKILTCFIAPSEGTASINGHDIWQDPIGVRASIGYLPESTPLYPEMLVAEYLEFMGQMRGLRGAQLGKRIKAVVEETSLGEVFAKEIRALSKGFKQRVGLAQALIHEPPVLILDEPMSGLDPNQMTDIRDLIREIGRSRTVMLSTHNLHEIHLTCSRVFVIGKGKLVADTTPAALADSKPIAGFHLGLAAGATLTSVQAALGRIPGVRQVRATDGTNPLDVIVDVDAGRDVRADVSAAAAKAGLVIVELSAMRPDLYAIFRELTEGEPATIGPRSAKSALAPADDEDDEEEDDDSDEDE
jgi:ABC-2 type transport system ATP-binding protein